MLNRLYLDKCFTHNDRTFHFENGLTGIIGPNESGKSLIGEMIRYALFGTKALRGLATDYKGLHVELDFTVKDEQYAVLRKGTKVTLSSETLNVSGTKPVDAAIREILGYGMEVFDVANACNQGNVEALSNMTPMARKDMVDRTIGLTVLDRLITHTGQEARTLTSQANGLEAGLQKPTPPVEPEGYVLSTSIELPREEVAEFQELKGFLASAPTQPERPAVQLFDLSEEEFEEAIRTRNNLKACFDREIRERDGLTPEPHSAEDLDDFEAWMDKADAWATKQRLLSQGFHTCEACQHETPLADLSEYADIEETLPPTMSRQDLKKYRAMIGNKDQIKTLDLSIAAQQKEHTTLMDRSDELASLRAYKLVQDSYQVQQQAWEQYNAGLSAKAERFNELTGVEDLLREREAAVRSARDYELENKRYETAQAHWEEQDKNLKDLREKAQHYKKAQETIRALKTSVKTHLLPSLNTVASLLLSQMTDGERYLIEIDEEFEILVDGQRINTLSGSGKAVANLAIRIALGQILTNKVFSLFMADEVDASMDNDRAMNTAAALQRLTRQVGQVILVTHKRPETDHTFELKA
jgi:DNA repair exonuclease SbcCD ATPase subunit